MSGIPPFIEFFESAFRGPAWHGPSLRESLTDVDAQLAGRRWATTHTIHELVLHVTSWKLAVVRRLTGEAFEPEDFPAPEEWTETLRRLDHAHHELITAIGRLDDARLQQLAPGRDHTVAFMLHGAALHDIYHAGQIGVLKKLGV